MRPGRARTDTLTMSNCHGLGRREEGWQFGNFRGKFTLGVIALVLFLFLPVFFPLVCVFLGCGVWCLVECSLRPTYATSELFAAIKMQLLLL